MNRTILIILGLLCAVIAAAGIININYYPNSKKAQTLTFEEWLKETEHVGQYRDIKILNNLPKEKIIVVRNDLCDGKANAGGFDGNYDHIQNVLDTLGIPHTLIGKSELEKDKYSLDDKWIVLFNCSFFHEHCCNPKHRPGTTKTGARVVRCEGEGAHQIHESKFSYKTIKKIRRFAETGGYLFTEDLNIEEIIMVTVRAIITYTKYLPEKYVTILPAPDEEKHPYLKDVFKFPVQPTEGNIEIKWKIDDESPNIRVLNKAATALIVSPQLVNKWDPNGTVAVTFPVPNQETGQPNGQVLHIMTHFGRQASKIDEFALQNLLVNFLMEMAEKKK